MYKREDLDSSSSVPLVACSGGERGFKLLVPSSWRGGVKCWHRSSKKKKKKKSSRVVANTDGQRSCSAGCGGLK